jgi:hypothetical protein
MDQELDLALLRDLLRLLREFGVSSFSGAGLSLSIPRATSQLGTIRTVEPDPEQSEEGEPPRRAPLTDGFKHPSLWPDQNGRLLRFDGSLE